MKFIQKLSLFALVAMLALVSCQKEEIFISEVDTVGIEPTEKTENGLINRSLSGAEGLQLGCISIDYPFEMTRFDGSTVDISSEEDYFLALEDEGTLVDFVYPLAVTDQDGLSFTVNDLDELAETFADCVPNTGWGDEFSEWFFPAWLISYENSCYQLVYPVTLLDVDSSAVTAEDENELIQVLSDGNIYSFAFPLSLLDEDGNPVAAVDVEDLFDLLSACNPFQGGGFGIGTFVCYELGYPATLLLLDGSTLVVNDIDEFAMVLMGGEFAGFGFPLTLVDEEGNEIVVNNETELDEALINCVGSDDPGETGDFMCYDFVYPIQLKDLNSGNNIVFNNSDDWEAYMLAGGIPFEIIISIDMAGNWVINLFANGNMHEFVYPLTLLHAETSEEVTVGSDNELFEALQDCW